MNKETDIHNRILLRLSQEFHPTGIFWRQNAGRVQTKTGAWVALGPPGISDIVGVIKSQAVFVEVKTETGKQRKIQIQFQRAVESAGGIYIVARDPDSAVKQLKEKLQ